MAIGGLVGGIFLAGIGEIAIPIAATAFVVLSLTIIASARRHAFPSRTPSATAVPGEDAAAMHR